MGKSVACLKDRVTWTAAENPNLPKAAKIPLFEKACNSVLESYITPQIFNCRPKLVQLDAMLGLYY